MFFIRLIFLWLINALLRFKFVLVSHCMDDVVWDSPHSPTYAQPYVIFRFLICYWFISFRFFINYCFISFLTACCLLGSSTILLASLRQSRKIRREDRFSINCAGFMFINCNKIIIWKIQSIKTWRLHMKWNITNKKYHTNTMSAPMIIPKITTTERKIYFFLAFFWCSFASEMFSLA